MNKKHVLLIGITMLSIAIAMASYTTYHYKSRNSLELNFKNSSLYNTDCSRYFPRTQHKPILVFYFKTDCPYCKAESEEILKHIDKFNQYDVLFISSEIEELIKLYSLNFPVNQIRFLKDENNDFRTSSFIKKVPTILIFSQEGKLTHRQDGYHQIQDILNIISNEKKNTK